MTNVLYNFNYLNFKDFILYYISILDSIKKNLITINIIKLKYIYIIINNLLIIFNELNKINFLKINFLFLTYSDLLKLLKSYNKKLKIEF